MRVVEDNDRLAGALDFAEDALTVEAADHAGLAVIAAQAALHFDVAAVWREQDDEAMRNSHE